MNEPEHKIVEIPICLVDLDDLTFQYRTSSKGKNVAYLQRIMTDGAVIDPIMVRRKGKRYQIIDGFQRVEGTRLAFVEGAMIRAYIFDISDDDATLKAAAANQKHGLKLTAADRANIYRVLIESFPDKSNGWIADQCFVTEGTIRRHRKLLEISGAEKKEGRDGKLRKDPTKLKTKPEEGAEKLSEIQLEIPDEILNDSIGNSETSATPEVVEPASQVAEAQDQLVSAENGQPAPPQLKGDRRLLARVWYLLDLREALETCSETLEHYAQQDRLAPDEKLVVESLVDIVDQIEKASGGLVEKDEEEYRYVDLLGS